jgi:hypothetical protein
MAAGDGSAIGHAGGRRWVISCPGAGGSTTNRSPLGLTYNDVLGDELTGRKLAAGLV